MAQRALGRVFLRQTPGQIISPGIGSRAFSESAKCLKEPVPEFSQTSSPELDALLTKYREELFIPESLGPRHKNLIYKKKNVQKLNTQAFMVQVRGNDAKFQLKPTSMRNRPTNKDFKTAIFSMSTYEDWCNLLPLLSGLKDSKRILSPAKMEWLVRTACRAGKHGIILECANKAKRTGLELRDVNVARSLFHGLRDVAQKSDFGRAVVERSLEQGKQAADLIKQPNQKDFSIKEDATRRPDIIGVLLELSASRAINAFEGKDQNGEVAPYAQRTLDTWPVCEGDFDLRDTSTWSDADRKLKQMMPLWHGMQLALKVKEVNSSDDLRTLLKKRIGELEPKIEAAMKLISEADLSYLPPSMTMSQELYKKE